MEKKENNVAETNVTELKTESEDFFKALVDKRHLEGIFTTDALICVQLDKRYIGEDGGKDYYYNLTFSDGQNVFSCTSGKIGDDFKLFKPYYLGLNYVDKKLKIVDFQAAF